MGAREPLLPGYAERQIFALLHFPALGAHPLQEILKAGAIGNHPVYGLPQLLLKADAVFHCRDLAWGLGLSFRVFNDGQAMGLAERIVQPPEDKGRVLYILKLSGTV